MAAPIEIAISVEENVTAALDAAVLAGGDMTPAMGEISRYLVAEAAGRFRNETGPDGVPWRKSLRVTGYTRADGTRVEGDGGQTLSLSGDLRRSLREDFGKDFAAAGPEASGGAAVYAAIHQFGGKIIPRAGRTALSTPFGFLKSVVIPARPYLGFTAADGEEVVAILSDHIDGAFAVGPAA